VNSHNFHKLVQTLFEHASGLTGPTAATGLLAEHQKWLTRLDFQPFIQHGRRHDTAEPIASIRWRAALTALNQGRLPCSGSEADILRIAASLAAATPVRLRNVLGSLDHRNIAHVVKAIALANDTWPIDTQGTQS
jgi:hypothetical protein